MSTSKYDAFASYRGNGYGRCSGSGSADGVGGDDDYGGDEDDDDG